MIPHLKYWLVVVVLKKYVHFFFSIVCRNAAGLCKASQGWRFYWWWHSQYLRQTIFGSYALLFDIFNDNLVVLDFFLMFSFFNFSCLILILEFDKFPILDSFDYHMGWWSRFGIKSILVKPSRSWRLSKKQRQLRMSLHSELQSI